jgi:four helix bundle protein
MQNRGTQNLEPRTSGAGSSAEGGYSYRNLIVWQKAQTLTLAIVRLAAKLPDDRVNRIITDQIVRSSSSIGANIAEGHGRFSLAAHANYVSIAKASACETDSWLDLLRRTGRISDEIESQLQAGCTELIRMLTSKILELGRQNRSSSKSPRIAEEVAIYATSDYAESLDQTPDDFDPEVLGSPVLGSPVLGSAGRGEEVIP